MNQPARRIDRVSQSSSQPLWQRNRAYRSHRWPYRPSVHISFGSTHTDFTV